MLGEGLGVEYQLTTNGEEFAASPLPKINYSASDVPGALHIKPQGILLDVGIKDYHLEVLNNLVFKKTFFRTTAPDVPFDLFGAAFWLLSRYEEYLPHKPDGYNRFHYRSSLAYQYDFIQWPLINIWLAELKKILQQKFPTLVFKPRAYNFVSSVDIDNAYLFKHKGLIRTLAGFLADRSFERIKNRLRIILNKQADPFDCYDFLIEAHKAQEVEGIYFFLLGDYGDNDKNHSSSNLRFQSLIKHMADYSPVGIHPSFGSSDSLHQLKVETNRLSNITHRVITRSRQHFSMLKFPRTYQDLLQAGILEDHSMGYTNLNGYRASYCMPFQWYSLDNEFVSPLQLHPFAITENMLQQTMQQEGKSFIEAAAPFVEEIKKHGGELMPVFHNDTFTDVMRKDYIEFLRYAK